MKELVEYLARALVDNPEPVEVRQEGDDAEPIFHLKVGDDDLGKVIGKKGRTAKALRTLLSAAAAKQDVRMTLEIVEPPRRKKGDRKPDAKAQAPAAPEAEATAPATDAEVAAPVVEAKPDSTPEAAPADDTTVEPAKKVRRPRRTAEPDVSKDGSDEEAPKRRRRRAAPVVERAPVIERTPVVERKPAPAASADDNTDPSA